MSNRLIVVVMLATWSCHDPKGGIPGDMHSSVRRLKDSIAYTLLPGGNGGYGFDILENGKVYIHQPFIPTWEGFREFPSPEAATAVASLLVSRLWRREFRFLLDKREVDSLLKKFPASFIPFRSDTTISAGYPASFRALPALPEPPLKKKWITHGKVPFGKRSIPRSFGIGQKVYIGSGEYNDHYSNDLWCYNTDTRAWTCLASFPTEDTRAAGIAFAAGNKGYWGLGNHAGPGPPRLNNEFFEYNPALNRWSRKKNFPGTPRVDAAAFVIGNKGYVGTGFYQGQTTDMYRYDPQDDHWERIADFPGHPVSAALGVSDGRTGFIIGGDGPYGNQRTCYEYDAVTGKWDRKKDMPGAPRYFLSGSFIDTDLFIAGGGGAKDSIIRLKDFYLYDASTGQWSRLKNYPASAAGISTTPSANAGGKIFFGGGFNGNYRDDWNSFDYYFSANTDTGEYHETTSFQLAGEEKWELFQECNERDCFAAMQLQTGQSLGDLAYSRRLVPDLRTLSLPGGQTLWFFPRNYAIQTDRQPQQAISIRLFFPRKELERALDACKGSAGRLYSMNDLRIFQCNEDHPDTDPLNNTFSGNSYTFITPRWYTYGFEGDLLIAEFPVSSLHSEFYLVTDTK